MVNEVGTPAVSPAPIVIKLDANGAASRVARTLGILAIVGGTFVAIGVGVIAFRAMRPATSALDALHTTGLRSRESMRRLSLRDLATLSERGYRQVDVQEPPGGWKAFDPVAGLPWVTEVARAWNADARLTRIDLAMIAADGTADLTTDRDDTVGYRFSSPGRIAVWERVADREANASVPYELMVRVAQRAVMVYVHDGRPPQEALPPPLDGMALRDLLGRLREQPTFPQQPFYSGFLLHLDRMGWVWRFSSLSQRDSFPWIRATDGAVYPWGEAPPIRPRTPSGSLR